MENASVLHIANHKPGMAISLLAGVGGANQDHERDHIKHEVPAECGFPRGCEISRSTGIMHAPLNWCFVCMSFATSRTSVFSIFSGFIHIGKAPFRARVCQSV